MKGEIMCPIHVCVLKVEGVVPTTTNGIIDAIRCDPKASAVFTEFEKSCADYRRAVHDDCVKDLNKRERLWFERWWKGEIIDWKRMSKKAHSAILAACGAGCG
jgi:hypothetical protein